MAALVSSIAAIVATWLLRETLTVTQQTLIEVQKATQLSEGTLEETKESFSQEAKRRQNIERSWLRVDLENLEYATHQMTVTAKFQNIGKSPINSAQYIRCWSFHSISKKNLLEINDPTLIELREDAVKFSMFPGDEHKFYSEIELKPILHKLNPRLFGKYDDESKLMELFRETAAKDKGYLVVIYLATYTCSITATLRNTQICFCFDHLEDGGISSFLPNCSHFM